jgi:hypothetical protein
VQGEEVRARGRLAIEASPCPIVVAALGPRMLELAGREADGTVLWMVGPKTVRDHIAPRIRDAAARADRPAPRIVAGVPVCVTDDVAAARAFAKAKLGVYGGLPAYRAMLELEGVAHPENLLVAGSEAKVRDALAEYAAGGTTDLRAAPLCDAGRDRARARSSAGARRTRVAPAAARRAPTQGQQGARVQAPDRRGRVGPDVGARLRGHGISEVSRSRAAASSIYWHFESGGCSPRWSRARSAGSTSPRRGRGSPRLFGATTADALEQRPSSCASCLIALERKEIDKTSSPRSGGASWRSSASARGLPRSGAQSRRAAAPPRRRARAVRARRRRQHLHPGPHRPRGTDVPHTRAARPCARRID